MTGLKVVCFVLLCPLLALGQVTHTICDVQAYDAQGFSPLQGDLVAVQGVVTLPPGHHIPMYTFVAIEADDCGVGVFCFDSFAVEPALGDSLYVLGSVEEYVAAGGDGAFTEIFVDNPSYAVVVSSGNPEPVAVEMDCEGIQVEDNEGRLLKTVGAVSATDNSSFIDITDQTGTLRVSRYANETVSFAAYQVGDTLSVTGILFQRDPDSPFLEGYELFPRFQTDIERSYAASVHPTYWGDIKARHAD